MFKTVYDLPNGVSLDRNSGRLKPDGDSQIECPLVSDAGKE